MANTIRVSRAQLTLGICMPLAVLLGYLLAEPLEPGSMAVVVLVLFALSVPLLMRWHHPLLVLSWHLALTPVFLPGRAEVRIVMSFASLLFAVLNRSVTAQKRFLYVPSLARPLFFLGAVVVGTALLTGGFGLASLGSEQQGGRGYYYLLAAIAGFFALTSERIPPPRAMLYLAMFFLPSLTALVGHLAYAAGPAFYFLFDWFSPGAVLEQADADYSVGGVIGRWGGLINASTGLSGYLLARYGLRGVLDPSRPVPCLLFILSAVGCVFSGYRSVLILFLLIFAIMFWLEGLHRTRLLPLLAGVGLFAGCVALSQVQKLPFVVQRSLSFLPVQVDPIVRQSAESSTDWRIQMWKVLLPEIPKHLIKGKGYALDPDDLFLTQMGTLRQPGESSATFLLTGDYHNGGLSVLLPFGIFGALGFVWFLLAGLRYLYGNYRRGAPALRQVNTFLLAAFLAQTVFFFAVFGAFRTDFYIFTGLLGLSVSLNGWPAATAEAEERAGTGLAAFSSRA